jgi:hypothetical protein
MRKNKSREKQTREKPKLKRKKTKEEVDLLFKRLSKSKKGNTVDEVRINNKFLRTKSREKYFKRKKYLSQKGEREVRRNQEKTIKLSKTLMEYSKLPSEE